MEEVLKYIEKLFTEFGWYSLAIVGATFLIMILVNILITKIFIKATSESASRLRKTICQILVFVVSAGVITFGCYLLNKPLDVKYIAINCIPCGGLSMILWAVVKIIRDLGFKPLISLLINSNEVKSILNKIDIDKTIKNKVYNLLCDVIENTDGSNAELVISKANQITSKAKELLTGFVENPNSVALQFLNALQIKYVKKEK